MSSLRVLYRLHDTPPDDWRGDGLRFDNEWDAATRAHTVKCDYPSKIADTQIVDSPDRPEHRYDRHGNIEHIPFDLPPGVRRITLAYIVAFAAIAVGCIATFLWYPR